MSPFISSLDFSFWDTRLSSIDHFGFPVPGLVYFILIQNDDQALAKFICSGNLDSLCCSCLCESRVWACYGPYGYSNVVSCLMVFPWFIDNLFCCLICELTDRGNIIFFRWVIEFCSCFCFVWWFCLIILLGFCDFSEHGSSVVFNEQHLVSGSQFCWWKLYDGCWSH